LTQIAFAVVQKATGKTEPEKEIAGKKADSKNGGRMEGRREPKSSHPKIVQRWRGRLLKRKRSTTPKLVA